MQLSEYKHQWYLKHKEECTLRMKKWNKEHPEYKCSEKRVNYLTQYRKDNKDKAQIYRDTHKEIARVQQKEYYEKNKERRNKEQSIYLRNRLRTNPEVRLVSNLRRRVWEALRGISKAKRTMELLGCTRKELLYHLERQFKPGMNWDNYGKKGWVLDHIIPCAFFNLNDTIEQKQCFFYQNLRPMWDKDNLMKSDSISNTMGLLYAI